MTLPSSKWRNFSPYCFLMVTISFTNPCFSVSNDQNDNEFSIIAYDAFSFHGDYTPPSPPPPTPPPHPPSLSCEDDLQGIGSLNTICQLNNSLNFAKDVYIAGNGTLDVLPGVRLECPLKNCSILVNMSRNFNLAQNSVVLAGTVSITAYNVTLFPQSLIIVTGLAGQPPAQTSGSPSGVQGAGGGHGGRGASCVSDNTKLPDDVWGGDTYSWSDLDKPYSYGSRGGTTSKEEDSGGEGGGRIWFEVVSSIEVCGNLLADGGDGGVKGGGGSGGSIYIKAQRM